MASSATADIATVEMSMLNLPTDNFTAAPLEISFLMPRSLDTTIHLRISFLGPSTMLFLTTTSMGSSQAISPLGSFVYAMPDRTNPKSTVCTPLYSSPSSVEYASRTARILARRTGGPVHVGCSVQLSGVTLEEEMEGLRKVIDIVMGKWEEHRHCREFKEKESCST